MIGIDYNARNLEVAQKMVSNRALSNVRFYQRNIYENLDFAPRSFDKILLLDVLEHLSDRDTVLAKLRRLLKDKGLILIALPNRVTRWKKIRKSVGLPYYHDSDHKIEYTQEEICEEMRRNRFEIFSDFSPVVIDTPLEGLIDLIGGISLHAYRGLINWKISAALKNPGDSTGWRFVVRKLL